MKKRYTEPTVSTLGALEELTAHHTASHSGGPAKVGSAADVFSVRPGQANGHFNQ